jgi:hypothetical protein
MYSYSKVFFYLPLSINTNDSNTVYNTSIYIKDVAVTILSVSFSTSALFPISYYIPLFIPTHST